MLEILPTDTTQDIQLQFLIEQASSWIDEILGRSQWMEKKSRTEFYNGSGSGRLLLNARPVFLSPAPTVIIDQNGGFFGSPDDSFVSGDTIEYGETNGWCLDIDQPDGTSRSGILVRIGGYWPKPNFRQPGLLSSFVGKASGNIKITYTGGYTVESLPAVIRLACNLLVARLKNLFPLGMQLVSESYEERHIAYLPWKKNMLDGGIRAMLWPYRNWTW